MSNIEVFFSFFYFLCVVGNDFKIFTSATSCFHYVLMQLLCHPTAIENTAITSKLYVTAEHLPIGP